MIMHVSAAVTERPRYRSHSGCTSSADSRISITDTCGITTCGTSRVPCHACCTGGTYCSYFRSAWQAAEWTGCGSRKHGGSEWDADWAYAWQRTSQWSGVVAGKVPIWSKESMTGVSDLWVGTLRNIEKRRVWSLL